MNEQLQMLLKLQELDLEGDEINSTRSSLDENLKDANGVLDRLGADLDAQNIELEATNLLHEEKKREYREAEERQKKSKARLTKVSNTKEYAAIELELENVKRQVAQLDEELAQLREAIDASRATGADKEAKIDALTQQIKLETDEANKQYTRLEKALTKLTNNRSDLTDKVSKPTLRQYNFIRSRRTGHAVMSVLGGSCQGCFMQLPPQLFIELQKGQRLIACPSCQRLLFFEKTDTEK